MQDESEKLIPVGPLEPNEPRRPILQKMDIMLDRNKAPHSDIADKPSPLVEVQTSRLSTPRSDQEVGR